MTKAILAAYVILFACSALHAQDVQPTCKNCPGTYIPSEEIQAYAKRAVATKVIDQQVRAVDIGKSNVDIGLVYRGKLDDARAGRRCRARPGERGLSRN